MQVPQDAVNALAGAMEGRVALDGNRLGIIANSLSTLALIGGAPSAGTPGRGVTHHYSLTVINA